MIVEGKAVFIIDIQRKPRNVNSKSGDKQVTEEPYSGFVFTAENQNDVDEIIQYFMNRVRSVKGIVKNLLKDCPNKAYAFQHSSASLKFITCESAVLNALGKVGIKISKVTTWVL
jgi:hypothetical protein